MYSTGSYATVDLKTWNEVEQNMHIRDTCQKQTIQ